jgi:hypothetical protein
MNKKRFSKPLFNLKANKLLTYLTWIHNNENISIAGSCKVSSKHYFKMEPLVAKLFDKQIGRVSWSIDKNNAWTFLKVTCLYVVELWPLQVICRTILLVPYPCYMRISWGYIIRPSRVLQFFHSSIIWLFTCLNPYITRGSS